MENRKRVKFIPIIKLSPIHIERFNSRLVKAEDQDDCWGWNGSIATGGYGILKIKFSQYRITRISYFIFYGVDPKELFVCHKCDNPICANPKHLFLGTQLDNMRDASLKKRTPIGERAGNAVLKERDISKIVETYTKGGISELGLSKLFNVSQSTINRALRGESWKHIEVPGKGKVTKNRKERGLINHHSRAVLQFDLNGNEIARYNCIADASKNSGCNATSIAVTIRKGGGEFKNYIWKPA